MIGSSWPSQPLLLLSLTLPFLATQVFLDGSLRALIKNGTGSNLECENIHGEIGWYLFEDTLKDWGCQL